MSKALCIVSLFIVNGFLRVKTLSKIFFYLGINVVQEINDSLVFDQKLYTDGLFYNIKIILIDLI